MLEALILVNNLYKNYLVSIRSVVYHYSALNIIVKSNSHEEFQHDRIWVKLIAIIIIMKPSRCSGIPTSL